MVGSILTGFMAVFDIVFVALYFKKYAQLTVWQESVYNNNKLMPKLVIIKSKSGETKFQEFGDLSITDWGAVFFYGNGFLGQRKILWINALSSKQEERPVIKIEPAVIENMIGVLYVETMTPVKIAGKDADYHELNKQTSALEVLVGYGDTIVEAVTRYNKDNIKEKVHNLDVNNISSKGT